MATTMMIFDNIKSNGLQGTFQFEMKNCTSSMVNALRRTVLSNIENTGFCYEPANTITVVKNTTALHDEIIAHRIGMLPVLLPGWIDNQTMPLDDYEFRLDVSDQSQQTKGGLVTTDDFTLFKRNNIDEDMIKVDGDMCKKCFPKNPILITRFPRRDAADQQLTLRAKLTTGTHSVNAGFSPVSICVAYETAPHVHVFKVESIGLWLPEQLVAKGLENLILGCDRFMKKAQDPSNSQLYDGNYKALDIILHGETHTMGNMIQEWIYNSEFPMREDSVLAHVGYHEPHPLENRIILRVGLKNNTTQSFDDYREQIIHIVRQKTEKLKKKLQDMYNTWSEISAKRANVSHGRAA